MSPIKIVRYSHPVSADWAGYIEPKGKGWVAFVDLAGELTALLSRNSGTGATVLPSLPELVA
jgi:hypothetical protein